MKRSRSQAREVEKLHGTRTAGCPLRADHLHHLRPTSEHRHHHPSKYAQFRRAERRRASDTPKNTAADTRRATPARHRRLMRGEAAALE